MKNNEHLWQYLAQLSVGPLLPFEDFTSILVSPGQVTGPSQGESSGGAATLIQLDLHAFL